MLDIIWSIMRGSTVFGSLLRLAPDLLFFFLAIYTPNLWLNPNLSVLGKLYPCLPSLATTSA